uniref:Uncharacterized protein n=1 Tax=Pyxicephalus adspersus TaxID=30357 RepID=A0AAV3AK80_PYXAD|nr:TPA: hypothetical protein GDO54_007627 [Pyxicephalus adspersus]
MPIILNNIPTHLQKQSATHSSVMQGEKRQHAFKAHWGVLAATSFLMGRQNIIRMGINWPKILSKVSQTDLKWKQKLPQIKVHLHINTSPYYWEISKPATKTETSVSTPSSLFTTCHKCS